MSCGRWLFRWRSLAGCSHTKHRLGNERSCRAVGNSLSTQFDRLVHISLDLVGRCERDVTLRLVIDDAVLTGTRFRETAGEIRGFPLRLASLLGAGGWLLAWHRGRAGRRRLTCRRLTWRRRRLAWRLSPCH